MLLHRPNLIPPQTSHRYGDVANKTIDCNGQCHINAHTAQDKKKGQQHAPCQEKPARVDYNPEGPHREQRGYRRKVLAINSNGIRGGASWGEHGGPRASMKPHEVDLWTHGVPWETHGDRGESMGDHGDPMKPRHPWGPNGDPRCPWRPKGAHEDTWGRLEDHMGGTSACAPWGLCEGPQRLMVAQDDPLGRSDHCGNQVKPYMAQEGMIEGGRCSGQACAAERMHKGKLGLCDDGYNRNGGCRCRDRCQGIFALFDVREMGN